MAGEGRGLIHQHPEQYYESLTQVKVGLDRRLRRQSSSADWLGTAFILWRLPSSQGFQLQHAALVQRVWSQCRPKKV